MLKKPKIKILIFLISIIIISGYLLISLTLGNDKFKNLKSLLTREQKVLIKKYIFPYKFISEQQQTISQQQQTISQQKQKISQIYVKLDLQKKNEGSEIKTKEHTSKLLNNKTFKKYQLTTGFYSGIHDISPGSGYIDFYEGNIIVLSSRGILAFKKNLDNDEINFKQIKNNIDDFIGIKQFSKLNKYSLKDLLLFNEKIYVSYTEEIKEDCWNTSALYGNINYESIEFKKLFSSKECVHSKNNIDGEWEPHQSGGRIVPFDDNHVLFSVGEYRVRHLAQKKESVFGKIIKININNSNYEIISMGHRNPQGLYFDKENNFILETEHGPQGGDEINLIEIDKLNRHKIPNYGWAIASAGEHYGGKIQQNKFKYEKYPLYKSHKEHGFIEPLESFVPSIGISEITKIGKDKYVSASLRDRSLYFFELNKEYKIINLTRVEVFERVRDMFYKDNKLYLFLEDTPSIGIINIEDSLKNGDQQLRQQQ